MKWVKAFFAVDNTVNENTVMGFLSWCAAVGFAVVKDYVAMGTFITFSAACFGLNLKKEGIDGIMETKD